MRIPLYPLEDKEVCYLCKSASGRFFKMLDLIFTVTLLVCFGFIAFFAGWCDRQVSK